MSAAASSPPATVAGPPTAPAGTRRAISARARQRLVLSAQMAPATIFLLVFLIGPLVVFLIYSFYSVNVFALEPGFSFHNYTDALTDANYQKLFRNTLQVGLVVAVLTTAVGYAFAHVIRFHLRRHQETLLFIVLVALFSGYLVRIYAWRTILGNHGVINNGLTELGLIDHPLTFLLFSKTAVIVVLMNYLIPLSILPIYASLQNVKDEEIEAARDLGAGAAKAFLRVTLPRARTGIFFGFAMTLILAGGDYLTPTLIGGADGVMIGTVIADSFGGVSNWPLGSATSILTTALLLGVLGIIGVLWRKVVR